MYKASHQILTQPLDEQGNPLIIVRSILAQHKSLTKLQHFIQSFYSLHSLPTVQCDENTLQYVIFI